MGAGAGTGRAAPGHDRRQPMSILLDLGEATPDAATSVEWLRNAARDLGRMDDYQSSRVNFITWLADKIEAQIPKPKPAEPTGLGAVVVDVEGARWIAHEPDPGRHGNPHRWVSAGYGGRVRLPYAAIDAVRVLSEGVSS